PDGRPELAAQCGRILGIITAILMGLLSLFARPIVNLLFSPEFGEVVVLIRIMAIGALIRCCGKAAVPYLVGTNRPGAYSTTIVLGTLVNLGLLLILLPVIGLDGAAWAMTTGHAVAGILLICMFHYYSKMSIAQAWIPRKADWELVRDASRKIGGKLAGAFPFSRRRT
ncbi:MAG: polysaccharide biosynthesis C-terminal domain-containing protein, partial [Planctomycetota bacterium]|nr:polysaccharide biosynthesis C-terminal domain-containing protein [Planctomycetota bacterium]